MSWPSTAVPPALDALRTLLGACASWIAAGGAVGQVHYPTVNPAGTIGTADTLPAALLERVSTNRKKYAEGVSGVVGGSLAIVLYLDSATYKSAASVEEFADTLAGELMAQDTLLPLQDIDIGEASDPTPGAIAAVAASKPTDYRSIRLVIRYGLTA